MLRRDGLLAAEPERRSAGGKLPIRPQIDPARPYAARDELLTELLDQLLPEAVHLGYSATEVKVKSTKRGTVSVARVNLGARRAGASPCGPRTE
jgi:hypothetical protein